MIPTNDSLYTFKTPTVTDLKALEMPEKPDANVQNITDVLDQFGIRPSSSKAVCAMVAIIAADASTTPQPLRLKISAQLGVLNTISVTRCGNKIRAFVALSEKLPFSGAQGIRFHYAIMAKFGLDGKLRGKKDRVRDVVQLGVTLTEDGIRRLSNMQDMSKSKYAPKNYGFFQMGSKRVVVYQELAKRDLLDQLQQKPLHTLDPLRKLKLVLNIIEAVDDVRAAGLTHRDLKCENFLYFSKHKPIKITDFGGACKLSDSATFSKVYGTSHSIEPQIFRCFL